MKKITKYLLLVVIVVVFLSSVGCGADNIPDGGYDLPRFTWGDIYEGDYKQLDSRDVAAQAERLLGYYERAYFYTYRFRSQQKRDFPLYDSASDVDLQGVVNISSDKLKFKLNAFVEGEYTKVTSQEKSTLDGIVWTEGFAKYSQSYKYYLDCNTVGESELTVCNKLSMSGRNIFASPTDLICSVVSSACAAGEYPFTVYYWLNNPSQNSTLSFYQCGKNKYKAVYDTVGDDRVIKDEVYFCIDDNDLLCVKAITTDNSAKGTLVQTTEARPIGFQVKMPVNTDEFVEAQHCHTYEDKWSFDENAHWIAATCNCGTDGRVAYGLHDLSDGKCSVCGFDPDDKDEHKHTYSDKWSFDETIHWHDPTCGHTGIAADKGEHDYKDGFCAICGYPEPTGIRYKVVTDEANNPLYAGVEVALKLTEKDVTIKSTYMGLPVKFISYGAFRNCEELQSVVLPDSIEVVEGIAFENCTSLQSITLPDNVQRIDYGAFAGCKSLKQVNLSANLKYIGGNAFYDCCRLTTVTLPSALENIDDDAFLGCVRLAEVVNNSKLDIIAGKDTYGKVAYYAEYVHSGVSAIKSVGDFTVLTAPDKTYFVDYAGKDNKVVFQSTAENCAVKSYAFFAADNIDEVVLPDSLAEIGSYAFCNSSVRLLKLPDGLTTIGTSAFEGCLSLKEISVPYGVKTIEAYTFRNSGLESVTIADGVKTIEHEAFENCGKLTSVIVGEGVESIRYGAFADCSSLKYVKLPSSLKSVEEQTFRVSGRPTDIVVDIADLSTWCSVDFVENSSNPLSRGGKLHIGGTEPKKLEIPSVVTEIKRYCFYGMNNAVEVSVPVQTTKISDKAFGLSKITSVNLPKNTVWSGAFSACTNLGKVYIEDWSNWLYTSKQGAFGVGYDLYLNEQKVTSLKLTVTDGLPSYAFYNCKSLTDVKLTCSGEVQEFAFAKCVNLTSVSLGEATKIGKQVFSGCTALTTLYIPASVTQIENGAFVNSNLKSVTVDEANTCYRITGNCLVDVTTNTIIAAFDDFVIPDDGMYTIGQYVFYKKSIKAIVIPQNVVLIESNAFAGCHLLEEITLHADTRIASYDVFTACGNLKKINYGGSVSRWKEMTSGFSEPFLSFTVYCSDGTVVVGM